MNRKICVMGMGYIGLPTAAMFASNGYQIVGVDVKPQVIEALNKGEIIIEEPYLGELVKQVVVEGKLKGSLVPEEADIFIIAVPTPIKADKSADMTYVTSATEAIVPYLRKGNTVILESTSPPGTVASLILPILEKSHLNMEEDLYVAHSPERVIPGKILIELVENSRIVGGINNKSGKKVKDIYKSFVKGEIFLTDSTTAELCKLMENTYRDVNIGLANELAMICDAMGVDAWKVIEMSNKHPRVNLHQPGPGVGGHCLAVDPWFVVEKQPEIAKMIQLGRTINDGMLFYVYNKIKSLLGTLKNKTITLLGITYKPDVDDIRESPILKLVALLEDVEGIQIKLYDPHVTTHKYLEKDFKQAVDQTDIVIIGVNHTVFKEIDYGQLTCLVYDTRNVVPLAMQTVLGQRYHLLGKG